MAEIKLTSAVGHLVKERPARSRLFEKLGIDYCCGGKLPLAKACAKKGLDPQQVLKLLSQEDQQAIAESDEYVDANAMSLTQLADHIQNTHHTFLKEELPRIGSLVRKVAAVHGQNFPWTLKIDGIYTAFAAELDSHMLKEEQILFPLIRALDKLAPEASLDTSMSVAGPINVMESEHEDAGDALAKMRKLSNDFTPPAEACNTFIAMLDGLSQIEKDMHQHVHKENNVLFPKAMSLEVQKLQQEFA